jgi:hypothetical protein
MRTTIMAVWTLCVPAIVFALPGAYELDFRSLPAADTVPAYKFRVTITLDGKPPVTLPFTVGAAATPTDVADLLVTSLADPLWKVKRDGDRVVVYSYDKSPVTGITVTSDGPKPDVRRVLLPPAPKK